MDSETLPNFPKTTVHEERIWGNEDFWTDLADLFLHSQGQGLACSVGVQNDGQQLG